MDDTIVERTPEEKLDYLIAQLAALRTRVGALEAKVLPSEPDPEIGLP